MPQKVSKLGIAFCVIGALVLLLLIPSLLRLIASNNSTTDTASNNSTGVSAGGYQYQYSVNEANAIVEADQKFKNDGNNQHPSTFDALKLIKQKEPDAIYNIEESSFTWLAQDQNDSSYSQACVLFMDGVGDIMNSHTRERILSEEIFNFKNNGAWYIASNFIRSGYYNNCPASLNS